MDTLRHTDGLHAFPRSRRRSALLGLGVALLLMTLTLAGCLAEKGEPSGPAPAVTTWDDVNAYFSGNTCQSCHPPGASLASQKLDHFSLTTESGSCTTNNGKLVDVTQEPDNAGLNGTGVKEQSCLWLAVTKQEGSDMFGASFPTSVTNTIGAWIDNGAPGPVTP
jgi:hypothetical protein